MLRAGPARASGQVLKPGHEPRTRTRSAALDTHELRVKVSHHCPLLAELTEVEEVSWEGVLVQVVVGEVQHFQSRQRPKASGQAAQTVHPGHNTHTNPCQNTHTHRF